MNVYRPPSLAVSRKLQFITGVQAVGGSLIRAFWMPNPATAGATIPDLAVSTRTWTYDATPAGGRYAAQGSGYSLSFDGATQYLTCPDADDLSFVEPLTFSIFVVANVTDTANQRDFLNKWVASGTQREWTLYISTTDVLHLELTDEIAGGNVFLNSNVAISQGSWRTFAVTYAGTGGASATTGAALYQDGAAIAVTAGSAGTYNAMANDTSPASIGAHNAASAGFFQGSLACVLLIAKALTVNEVAQLQNIAKRYFGL